MIYAPVIIPTLNRIEHLKRCIESLKNNNFAIFTELYIALDYPPSDRYVEGYNRVRAYLEEGIEGFKEVHLIIRDKNYGPILNGRDLERIILEKYDRYIFTEDDNEFSPCFLEYMDTGLERYENDHDIIAICADRTTFSDYDTSADLVKATYFSAYGYGTWKSKIEDINRTINREYIESICCSRSKMRRLRENDIRTVSFLASTLLRKEPIYQTETGEVPLIDTSYMIYACAEQKYSIFCPKTMVRNWGYDGSGANCVEDRPMTHKREIVGDKAYNVNEKKVVKANACPKWGLKRGIFTLSAIFRIFIWRLISKHRLID